MAAETVARVLMAMDDEAVLARVEAGEFTAIDARGLTAYERSLLRQVARRFGAMSRHPSVSGSPIRRERVRRGALAPALRYARFHLADRRAYGDLIAWAELNGVSA